MPGPEWVFIAIVFGVPAAIITIGRRARRRMAHPVPPERWGRPPSQP